MEIKTFINLHTNEQYVKPMQIGKSIHFHEDKKSKPKDVVSFSFPELPECKVEVRLCTFKINKFTSVLGIVTDHFHLPRETKIGGNGTYITEARFMREAAREMLLKHGLMICEEIQTYPFVKLIVTKVTPAHIENFTNKNKQKQNKPKNHENNKVRESDGKHVRESGQGLI